MALATVLIPALFSIERVRLTPKEHVVMMTMALTNRARTMSATDWYEELPAEIKSQLNKLDFADILDKIVKAGHAGMDGNEVTLYAAGEGRLAVCFGKG